jgi:hypothetical protein
MKNKTIISAITFLLISMFYVNSASAGPTWLNIEIPIQCGKPHTLLTAHHCPLKRAPNAGDSKKNTTLVFKCVGGGNNRAVTSFKTPKCGRVTVTTFKRHDLFRGWIHYAEVTTKNAACKWCGRSGDSTRRKRSNTFDMLACKPGVKIDNYPACGETRFNTKGFNRVVGVNLAQK